MRITRFAWACAGTTGAAANASPATITPMISHLSFIRSPSIGRIRPAGDTLNGYGVRVTVVSNLASGARAGRGFYASARGGAEEPGGPGRRPAAGGIRRPAHGAGTLRSNARDEVQDVRRPSRPRRGPPLPAGPPGHDPPAALAAAPEPADRGGGGPRPRRGGPVPQPGGSGRRVEHSGGGSPRTPEGARGGADGLAGCGRGRGAICVQPPPHPPSGVRVVPSADRG